MEAFRTEHRQEPDIFSLDSPPMAERSRSPLAGIGQTALERKEEVPNEILLEAQTFKALQEQVHENTARLNSVDWVATQTASLVHRDQELQASKQFLLMGWPKIDEKEREKEIKRMANYYGLMNKYQGSTTLKTKNGLAHFTIVDMWDKEARNEFLQHIKRDPHQAQGNTIVGRPQIPRYRREQDAPMKCAMKTLANIIGDNPKFSPTWEIQALWHDEWLLAVNTNDKDITKVQLYVPDHVKAEFETKFQEDWSDGKPPVLARTAAPRSTFRSRSTPWPTKSKTTWTRDMQPSKTPRWPKTRTLTWRILRPFPAPTLPKAEESAVDKRTKHQTHNIRTHTRPTL